jgi:hypothetical protein
MESARRQSEQDAATDFLLGGGEMGQRMRERDWSQTPFGSAENWPSSLKTSLSIMLASRFAMVVAWGPEFRFFYNDRYRPVLGSTKHPGALGTPAEEIFPEAWPFIGPLFESTRRGEAVALDDMLILSIATATWRTATSHSPTVLYVTSPAELVECLPWWRKQPNGSKESAGLQPCVNWLAVPPRYKHWSKLDRMQSRRFRTTRSMSPSRCCT